MGWGSGRELKERAMLNADLRQTLAEKLLLKGRMPQSRGWGWGWDGCGGGKFEFVFGSTELNPWYVLLRPQVSDVGDCVTDEGIGVGGSEAEWRSQCFFVKMGTSAKAQYRCNFIRALQRENTSVSAKSILNRRI